MPILAAESLVMPTDEYCERYRLKDRTRKEKEAVMCLEGN